MNTGIRIVPADLAFIMDDLRWYSEAHPDYGQDIWAAQIPIITNRVYSEHLGRGGIMEYPLEDVLAWSRPAPAYFHDNSIPYILAYAGMIGVERISLFGVDFSHANVSRVEAGREVATFWLGFLAGRGVTVEIASSSTLMQTHRRVNDPEFRPFYGYLAQPILEAR